MITLFRWYLMKKKEIEFKLALYTLLEQGTTYIAKNAENFDMMFAQDNSEDK